MARSPRLIDPADRAVAPNSMPPTTGGEGMTDSPTGTGAAPGLPALEPPTPPRPRKDRQAPSPPRRSCVERRRPQGPTAAPRSASGRSLTPAPPAQRARQPGGGGRKKINPDKPTG